MIPETSTYNAVDTVSGITGFVIAAVVRIAVSGLHPSSVGANINPITSVVTVFGAIGGAGSPSGDIPAHSGQKQSKSCRKDGDLHDGDMIGKLKRDIV